MRRTPLLLNHAVRALCLALGLIATSLQAHAQVPGPEVFAKTPTTPRELWDAADYLVRTGQAKQAVPYLKKFVESNPDDLTLLNLRDRYGARSFLKLQDDPATRPFAEPLMLKLAEASRSASSTKLRTARQVRRCARQVAGGARLRRREAPRGRSLRGAGDPPGAGEAVDRTRNAGLDPAKPGTARPLGRAAADRDARRSQAPARRPGRRRPGPDRRSPSPPRTHGPRRHLRDAVAAGNRREASHRATHATAVRLSDRKRARSVPHR